MKLTDTAALFTATLLAACGSGGGNNLPSTSTIDNSSQASTETGPRVPTGTPFGNGVILISKMDAANADFKNVRSPNSFNLLNIDGQHISIMTSKYEQKDFMKFNGGGEDRIVSGNKYSQVRFGIHQQQHVDTPIRDIAFAIGNITPTSGVDAIPTTGLAHYVGDSVLNVDNGSLDNGIALTNRRYESSALIGTSEFNVDFGKKTVAGTISAGNHTIGLQGNIEGSGFSGTQSGIMMQGNFFGVKAAEMGGTFKGIHNSNAVLGAFGAKK